MLQFVALTIFCLACLSFLDAELYFISYRQQIYLPVVTDPFRATVYLRNMLLMNEVHKLFVESCTKDGLDLLLTTTAVISTQDDKPATEKSFWEQCTPQQISDLFDNEPTENFLML